MKKNLTGIITSLFFIVINASSLFGEGKPATELNKKVKTEGLTGLNYFLATNYNDDRLMYALISTGSVIVLGLILTYIVGLVLKPHAAFNKEEI
ncbi:MAG: hypothetical protein HW421_3045 [Ignavibacteria bacterium]|nr:hypothetical protein [Ignavibacteria bacterium]